MTIFRLNEQPVFPPPALSEPDGLLAVGGDLSARRLLAAYAQGIFPWYSEDPVPLWWSPDPRCILEAEELHISRSLQRTLRARRYAVSVDTAFEEVILRCARKPRPSQTGTWITPAMIEAYQNLHHLGFAHSFEAWQSGTLVGGIYGVSLGAAFFGESMFTDCPDASKVALVASVQWLAAHGFGLIDCQVVSPHLLRLGAKEIPRVEFLTRLERTLRHPTRQGKWTTEGPIFPHGHEDDRRRGG